MAEKSAKKRLRGKELFWYIFSGIIGLLGLIFLVFGIVGDHWQVLYSDNWILQSENVWLKNWSHIGYRWWGLILLGIAAFISIVSLTLFAREGDRDSERALRRAQRLAIEAEPLEEQHQEPQA